MSGRQPRLLDEAALFEYALRALGGRGHSIGELREKLRRKAEQPQAVDAVLARLKQYGYVNDRKFADSYASARLSGQGHGRQRVLGDLSRKRVPPIVARQAVEEAFRGVDETAQIEQYLARRYRGKDLPAVLAEPKGLASAYRRLRTAGFGASNCIIVLKRYAARADTLEELEDETS